MSKIEPSGEQTGDLKGWSEMAQKLNGSLLKGAPAPEAFARPEPALAEKASSEAHSLWVIWIEFSWRGNSLTGRDNRYVELVRSYKYVSIKQWQSRSDRAAHLYPWSLGTEGE